MSIVRYEGLFPLFFDNLAIIVQRISTRSFGSYYLGVIAINSHAIYISPDWLRVRVWPYLVYLIDAFRIKPRHPLLRGVHLAVQARTAFPNIVFLCCWHYYNLPRCGIDEAFERHSKGILLNLTNCCWNQFFRNREGHPGSGAKILIHFFVFD